MNKKGEKGGEKGKKARKSPSLLLLERMKAGWNRVPYFKGTFCSTTET